MKPIIPETAARIWGIIVSECGADGSGLARATFLRAIFDCGCVEYRFGGSIGFGGKFYNDHAWRVGCYPEDRTPSRNAAIARANAKLAQLREAQ